MVGTGTTGHAESVQITFDPRQISYGRLLQIYFSVAHDPTELNRQGPDAGTQYRSAIFPTNAEAGRVAKAYIAQLDQAHIFDAAIVTKIEPDRAFYPAEDYHQDFLTLQPDLPLHRVQRSAENRNLKTLFPTSTAPTRCSCRPDITRACPALQTIKPAGLSSPAFSMRMGEPDSKRRPRTARSAWDSFKSVTPAAATMPMRQGSRSRSNFFSLSCAWARRMFSRELRTSDPHRLSRGNATGEADADPPTFPMKAAPCRRAVPAHLPRRSRRSLTTAAVRYPEGGDQHHGSGAARVIVICAKVS